jgi:diguanylate cyclase
MINNRLELAMDAGKHAFWDWDVKTNQTYFSPRYFTMLGYEPGDFNTEYQSWLNLLHPEDRHEASSIVQVCIKKSTPFSLDFRMKTKSGTWKWIRGKGKPYKSDRDGKLLRVVGTHEDITESKMALEELVESKKKYYDMIQNLMEGFYSVTPEGVLLEHNIEFTKILGLDPHKDYKGIFLPELWFTPENRKEYLEVLEKEGRISNYEIKVKRADDTKIEVMINARLVKDENGKPLRIEGSFLDISERKNMETKLLHSHNLMRYIIEHSNGAIAVHDKEMKYIYVSQRYLKDYKIEDPDIIGKHHYEVFPDLPQKWRDIHQRALKGEITSAERDPYPRADGTVEWTRWECRPWHKANSLIGGFIVYTEIITQRIKDELELKEKLNELEKFNKVMVGRENKMIELKREINHLLSELNLPARYSTPDESDQE